MNSCQRHFRQKTRSSPISTERRALRALALVLLCALLSGCADFVIVTTTPVPATPSFTLPPIGFNHRFGNTPVSSHDVFTLERAMYSQGEYWEVAMESSPASPGYVDLGDAAAVMRARHAVQSLTLLIATEIRKTITGLLAYRSNAGQEQYCEGLLQRVRALGYDAITQAQVLVFFTEADEHAKLTWSRTAGFTFAVYDNNLAASGVTPLPGQTPLPVPALP